MIRSPLFTLPFRRPAASLGGESTAAKPIPRERYDVVVVGGGVRALAVARACAGDGRSAGLFAPGEIAAAPDERAWPVIRAGNPDPLRMASDEEALRRLAKVVRGAAAPIGRDATGCLTLAASAHEVNILAAAAERAKAAGTPAWMVPPQEVVALSPPLARGAGLAPALYEPDALTVDADALAIRLAEAAQEAGAELFAGMPAAALERKDGAVTGLRLDRLSVAADAVVLADDSSAIRLVREGKGRLSLRRDERLVLLTEPGAPATGPALSIGEVTLTRNLAGAIAASGPYGGDALAERLVALAPSLAGLGVVCEEAVTLWSGVDGRAQIGAAEIPGLWLALGFGREALCGALPAAKEIASLMAGRPPRPQFAPFAPTRRLSARDRELLR